MSDKTEIEWADATWSPVTGCTRVSDGCTNCYIERTPPFRMAHRHFDNEGIGGTTGVQLHPERLTIPAKWRKPRRIFVCSMADLFHDDVPDGFIGDVFNTMALAERHTFQILTKRPARMRSLLRKWEREAAESEPMRDARQKACWRRTDMMWCSTPVWPLPNVWLGASTENQQWADIRIPVLLDTPAAVRFVSAEPLLGPINLRDEWMGSTSGRRAEQGERDISGGRERGTLNRQPGSGVAPCCTQSEPMGSRHGLDPVQTQARRASIGEVPAGARDVRGQQDSCACSQVGLAALQWPDTERVDSEPQERKALRQPSDQSRAVDRSGAGEAFPEGASSRQSQSIRPAESDGEALDRAGSRDLLAQSGRGITASAGGRIRREHADDLENCTGGSTLAWLIVGGESGRGARPMNPDWARSLRDQTTRAGVAYLFKQWGEYAPVDQREAQHDDVWVLGEGEQTQPWRPDTVGAEALRWGPHRDQVMRRVGKKAAGRELDGRTWDEYPGGAR